MWLNQGKRVETGSDGEEETALCVHPQFNLRLHGPGDLLVALNVDTNAHDSTCILVHKDFHLAVE